MALSASPAVAAPASPCDTPATHRIAQVPGSGEATPLPGQTVRVEGVVTGDFQRTDQEYNPPGLYQPDAFRSSDPTTRWSSA
ncbi:hypothetical protein [Nonomuraea sp. NPDC003709]|uniref:hypothetical protein n=1 Tax=Nonomuraea sp. NPDC003709 TaxID=3154450 RepID=UPI0033A5AC38